MTALPPSTPDVHWRRPLATDIQPLHALIRASEVADEAPFASSLEEVRQYAADPDLDLASDVLLGGLEGGRLACFAAVQMRQQQVNRRAVALFGAVHPEFRRRGLGTIMLRWSEAHAREKLARHDDDLPHFLEAWFDERLRDRRALFTSFGYRPIRF